MLGSKAAAKKKKWVGRLENGQGGKAQGKPPKGPASEQRLVTVGKILWGGGKDRATSENTTKTGNPEKPGGMLTNRNPDQRKGLGLQAAGGGGTDTERAGGR